MSSSFCVHKGQVWSDGTGGWLIRDVLETGQLLIQKKGKNHCELWNAQTFCEGNGLIEHQLGADINESKYEYVLGTAKGKYWDAWGTVTKVWRPVATAQGEPEVLYRRPLTLPCDHKGGYKLICVGRGETLSVNGVEVSCLGCSYVFILEEEERG